MFKPIIFYVGEYAHSRTQGNIPFIALFSILIIFSGQEYGLVPGILLNDSGDNNGKLVNKNSLEYIIYC